MPKESERSAGYPVRRRTDDGAKIGGKSEKRPRNRLRCAIAGKKCIVADPAWRHERLAQQRQDDMTAAEDQSARAVKGVEKRNTRRDLKTLQDGQANEQNKKGRQGRHTSGARDRYNNVARCRWRRAAAKPQAGKAAENYRGNLGDGRGAEQNDQRRREGNRSSLPVWAQRARHAQYSLCDDGYGDELEAMKQPDSHRPGESVGTVGEEDEYDCRRQSEAGPRRKSAAIAGPRQPNRKSDLAGSRTGQKLAECYQIDVSLFIEPASAHDEFFAEIPDVSDWPAEATHSELEENEQYFERRAHALALHLSIAYGAGHRVVSYAGDASSAFSTVGPSVGRARWGTAPMTEVIAAYLTNEQ